MQRKKQNKHLITEKQIGIEGDYQFKALSAKNYLQANWHRNKLVVIKKLLDFYQTKTLIDLGTGSGNLELRFAKDLTNIVGVDYNDEALSFLKTQLIKRKIKNVKLIQGDLLDEFKITKLGKFDMIIMVDVIEHLEAKRALKLIVGFKKMLTEKGKIVIITPNYQSFWPFIETIMDKFSIVPHLSNVQHVTKFNPKMLEETFKVNGGYKMISFSTFNNFSFLFPWKGLSTVLCKIEFNLHFPLGNLMIAVFEK